MTSGGSIIGIKYNGGVLLASDTLLSYGSLAKIPNVQRPKIIGKYTAICATGDFGDFQSLASDLELEVLSNSLHEDGIELSPCEIFSHLHRIMYHMRSKFTPCLCQFVVIGHFKGEAFLGAVDDIGTKWTDDCVATGYGAHIAVPLLRRALDVRGAQLSRDEAMTVITDCLRALYYRECRTTNRFQVTDASAGHVVISEPATLDTVWDHEGFSFENTAIIR